MPVLQPKPTRLFLKNVLFATDFSTASARALPYVKALARHYGSTVFVAHVYPTEPTYEIPMDVPPELRHNRKSAEAGMKAFLEEQDFTNIPHEVLLQAGDIWHALSQIVDRKDIDLLVVGTHGRKALITLVLGSVAEEVIRCADCPVLTIPSHVTRLAPPDGEFRHILYATDFSCVSAEALAYALSLAQESEAMLTLLHVVEEPAIDVSMPDQSIAAPQALQAHCAMARERLCEMLPANVPPWRNLELLVQAGTPSDTILKAAQSRGTDLIVLGARRTRVPHLVAHAPWRTVHRVICEAECPVLTVHG